MSYDKSNSAPGNDTQERVGSANEEEEEKGVGTGVSFPGSNNSGSQLETSDLANRERGSSPCGSGAGGSSGGDQRGPTSDDGDALSSVNDSGERESSEGGRQSGSGFRGRQSRSSHCSSSQKDSGMMLENTESNKSSNSQSQSPSPPSSSLAYSLLSASSEQDPPSTSGCSSNEQHQTARIQTQKEMLKALKELKIRLPAERKGKGCSSTLDALKYALNCVKQVRANQEYYHQWGVEECHGCSLDLSSYTIEELDNITSEYTLKNTDTFSMAVSFVTGKVVYISPQGSSMLRCKPERLLGAIFSELLAPQDVSTFYSSTAPSRLPPWATCMGSVSPPTDCTQEKSIFCRISADRAQGDEMKYQPFRMTPYQLTLRDFDTSAPQPCCLLLTERVHSGYEAPRIPADKRIFTTSHTPSCLFQEVDERAVPLLGYLPQDLVGTPVLLYLHPEDRPIMVAIHKKILQFAGQPFNSSPLRMCSRSGEYLTIDTSWSSFVNPWSRKVAFIVGRHKVRTSPLNEDVFTPLRSCEGRPMAPEIVQLSEQIHRLLVQPVHSGGSQGYSSLGSNGSRSHEQQHLSAASSVSDSKSTNAMEAMEAAVIALHKPMTFQQICKDVHMVKTSGQQVFVDSCNRTPPWRHAVTTLRAIKGVDPIKSPVPKVVCPPKTPVPNNQQLLKKEPPSDYSYQQINCLDSIIRYLDGCNVPNTVKRKFGSSSGTSTSDNDKLQHETFGNAKGDLAIAVTLVGDSAGVAPLPPLALHSHKAESVASVTSQCSFSSTIVHVGDKKPPESDIVMEDAPPIPTLATPTPIAVIDPPPPPPRMTSPPSRRGGLTKGLTKEVLSAHTQQEEQAFLCRFSDLSQLRVFDPASALRCPLPTNDPLATGARCSRDYPAAGGSRRRGRGAKRLKQQESSEQRDPLAMGMTVTLRGPNVSPINSPPISTYPLPLGPTTTTSSSWPASVGSQASLASIPYPPGMLPIYPTLSQPMGIPSMQNQMVPPMMALVLPNYMFPQLNPNMTQMATAMGTPMDTARNMMGSPMSQPGATMVTPSPQHFFNPNAGFPFPGTNGMPCPMPTMPSLMQTAMPIQAQRPASGSSTPQSCSQVPAEREGPESPLFHSRCSSPLNLLQLVEELPSNRLEVATALAAAAQQATPPAQASHERSADNSNENANDSNQDVESTSSDLLDLLLQEDSRSGTGSAASGSGFSGSGSSGSGSSGSNGCSSSGSGTSRSQSSHTSKYFGSIDSSENDHSGKQPAGGSAAGEDGEEQFIKCVLQDPIWLLMANTDDKVMMTYQLPTKDRETVLREDREALRAMHKHQPRFTEEQKRDLSQVHPWIRTGRLPRALNISACMECKSPPTIVPAAPFDVEIHEMELCSVLETTEKASTATQEKAPLPITAMDQGGQEHVAHAKTQGNDQEMTTEEQEVTSLTEEEKASAAAETDMTH
ncbi:period circadian protein homolog 1b isoform X1 [Coregonus clupeaformis]|uniref:period circadian protein homolog 1b isoform X1 n=1 Tax=Coregonus clupeaformis TaxID=59861 RepID=UPI001BE07F26|nr:period circadian protein homolog 1b isoform X1 [Coregonus clupeaformis]